MKTNQTKVETYSIRSLYNRNLYWSHGGWSERRNRMKFESTSAANDYLRQLHENGVMFNGSVVRDGRKPREERTLISIQDEAIEEILSAPENGPRAMGYGKTFLNRRSDCLRRIRKQYEREAGWFYLPEQVAAQWEDVKAVAALEFAAADNFPGE